MSFQLGEFLNPNPYVNATQQYIPNQVYALGSTLLITYNYTSNRTPYNVAFWELGPDNKTDNGVTIYNHINDTGIVRLNWTVVTTQPQTPNNQQFFFSVQLPDVDTFIGFESHAFNITSSQSAQPSATSTASVQSVAQTTTPPAAPAPTFATIITPKRSGLPPGAIAGIVIGVVAVAVLIGAALLFWLRRRRRQRPQLVHELPVPETSYIGDEKTIETSDHRHAASNDFTQEPHELPAPHSPVEMPGDHQAPDGTASDSRPHDS